MGKKMGFAAVLMTKMCSSYNSYTDRKKKKDVVHVVERGVNHEVNDYTRTSELIHKQNTEVANERGNWVIRKLGVVSQRSKDTS